MTTRWIATGENRAILMDGAKMVNAGRDSNIRRETYKCAPIGSDPPDPLPSPVLNVAQGGLPGFKQENPPDFIGGWTRLRVAGFTRGNPDWDGVICISGENLTHWLHISADEVVSSMSFLTLRLRILLEGSDNPNLDAISETLSRPERLASHLRIAQTNQNHRAITGHLMGAELAAARAYWLGRQVAVLGDGGYSAALAAQGVPFTSHDPELCEARGLAALAELLGY
ncbi:MAG: 2-dehydro-3-deoxygalactonokinase [Roseovarius sp.]|nr:2-dehydro-3-deoxygalactonokinase [Roseovarius sp.]